MMDKTTKEVIGELRHEIQGLSDHIVGCKVDIENIKTALDKKANRNHDHILVYATIAILTIYMIMVLECDEWENLWGECNTSCGKDYASNCVRLIQKNINTTRLSCPPYVKENVEDKYIVINGTIYDTGCEIQCLNTVCKREVWAKDENL